MKSDSHNQLDDVVVVVDDDDARGNDDDGVLKLHNVNFLFFKEIYTYLFFRFNRLH